MHGWIPTIIIEDKHPHTWSSDSSVGPHSTAAEIETRRSAAAPGVLSASCPAHNYPQDGPPPHPPHPHPHPNPSVLDQSLMRLIHRAAILVINDSWVEH